MHKEQRSQWNRDAIDLSVDPSDHAGEDLPVNRVQHKAFCRANGSFQEEA